MTDEVVSWVECFMRVATMLECKLQALVQWYMAHYQLSSYFGPPIINKYPRAADAIIFLVRYETQLKIQRTQNS